MSCLPINFSTMSRVPLGGSGYLVRFMKNPFTLVPIEDFHINASAYERAGCGGGEREREV